jgi:multiple sugar transport system ATP-binding protein
MASVLIKDARKSFGSTEVLHGVTVDIADGEFVILVGPSGCGKSTLLRMIAGLENITRGEIWIGGRMVNTVPPKERDIAMVFKNYALYPHMTVRDNMAFSLQLAKAPKAVIERQVQRAAEILGLAQYLNRYPRQLSGGQRQRVGVARALAADPAILLMDEPFGALDPLTRDELQREFLSLQKKLHKTVVFVTHDLREALRLASRIALMEAGKLVTILSPQEFLRSADPWASAYVRAFGSGLESVANRGVS